MGISLVLQVAYFVINRSTQMKKTDLMPLKVKDAKCEIRSISIASMWLSTW